MLYTYCILPFTCYDLSCYCSYQLSILLLDSNDNDLLWCCSYHQSLIVGYYLLRSSSIFFIYFCFVLIYHFFYYHHYHQIPHSSPHIKRCWNRSHFIKDVMKKATTCILFPFTIRMKDSMKDKTFFFSFQIHTDAYFFFLNRSFAITCPIDFEIIPLFLRLMNT